MYVSVTPNDFESITTAALEISCVSSVTKARTWLTRETTPGLTLSREASGVESGDGREAFLDMYAPRG